MNNLHFKVTSVCGRYKPKIDNCKLFFYSLSSTRLLLLQAAKYKALANLLRKEK